MSLKIESSDEAFQGGVQAGGKAQPQARPQARTLKGEIRPLTAVRFFAAIAVVLFHYAQDTIIDAPQWFRTLVASGYMGVTLFFMLSGFILVYVSAGTDLAAPHERQAFFVRRFARIYPVYLVAWVLVGALFLEYWLTQGVGLAYAAKVVAFHGGASAFLLQAWIPTAAPVWNWPGWSLSVEALFYAVFPQVYVTTVRHRIGALWAGLVFVVVANGLFMTLVSLPALRQALIGEGSGFAVNWADYLGNFPPLHLPEFLIGIALGHIYVAGGTPRWIRGFAPAVLAASLVCIGGVMATPSERFFLIPRDAWLPVFFGCLILALAHLPSQGRVASRIERRVGDLLVTLGAASYATYILQSPVFRLWVRAVGLSPGPMKSIGQVLVFVVVLIVLSVLIYRFFERPAELWIKRRLTSIVASQSLSQHTAR